jgi:hypothetical protein
MTTYEDPSHGAVRVAQFATCGAADLQDAGPGVVVGQTALTVAIAAA